MKQNRKGMTLAETMVALVVVGIVTGMTATTINYIKHDYTPLAHFAFKNIQALVTEMVSGKRNVEIDGEKKNAIRYEKVSIRKDDGSTEKKYETLLTTDDTQFCKFIGEYSNISGKIDCNNLFDISEEGSEPSIDFGIDDLVLDKPTYTTTNGQRYYLSKHEYSNNVAGHIDAYGFRILAVDLNGKRSPNKYDPNNGKVPPDIVQFLILDNGEVFPLGVAADNAPAFGGKNYRYINAQLTGYCYNGQELCKGEDGNANIAPECQGSLPHAIHPDNGTSVPRHTCSYTVKDYTQLSYREAFCKGTEHTEYTNYCVGIDTIDDCKRSSNPKFDICRVKTIKPLFRFNFK